MASINDQVLAALDPHQVSSVMSKKGPSIAFGHPVPGLQRLTVTSAMNRNCFVDDNTWRLILDYGEFDDIVVGSGFCALAYIDEAFKRDPFRKILLLERGGFWLPDHFQNLPLPFQFVRQKVSETFPWVLTDETAAQEKYLNGSSPFFGGRSSFWSIWSPRAIGPNFDLMDGFPPFMKEIAKEPVFYDGVEKLLHIQPANEIKDTLFDILQDQFDRRLAGVFAIAGAEAAEPARLACGVPVGRPTFAFRRFSAVGPLLEINEKQDKRARRKKPEGAPLMIATEVVVERFEVDTAKNTARVLHTSRGPISLRGGKTNVILATGAIPATTILMNSIGDKLQGRAGSRLTAHFRSSIIARFLPGDVWIGAPSLPSRHLMASSHVRGRASNSLQWHIQISGHYAPVETHADVQNSEQSDQTDQEWREKRAQFNAALFASVAPDHEAIVDAEQWLDSDGYVVVSCSVLGELPPDTNSWVEHNKSDPDVTTNVRVNIDISDEAKVVWNEMHKSTLDAINVIAGNHHHEVQ